MASGFSPKAASAAGTLGQEHAHELQQVLDQSLQMPSALAHDLRDFALLVIEVRGVLIEQQLRAFANRRERCLELVRDAPQEERLLFLELEDAPPQPVETAAKLLEILRPAHLHLFGETARAETAVQAWAARDTDVATRMRQVDAMRVGYLCQELMASGMDGTRAAKQAKALYLALIGLYSARGYNPDLADDEAYRDLVELVLASTRTV